MKRVTIRPTVWAMSAVLGVAAVAVTAQPAQAWVSGGQWDPGYIISDQQFYDGGAMSAAQIQSFLNQQVPTCHPEWSSGPSDPIVCLKDYRQTTVSRAADAYCPNAYVGATNESAATIIAKVAQACNVSPRVLLVTLQKEQGLVTHTWPSSYRYDIAMGYGCPDTGSGCMAEYYGFQNQVWRAARQFQMFRLLPTRYNYRAGVTNFIGLHPNAACGTEAVYIQNSATAALYNYTPYVPNQAALDAIPGTGNACSSYGNRNFWMYYWEWFGSPIASSSLLRTQANPTVYLISGSTKYPILDYSTYLNVSRLGGVSFVSQSYLDAYSTGQAVSRNFRNPSGIIALLDGGTLYPYATCQSMVNYGSSCASSQYVSLTDEQFNAFTLGTTLTHVVQTPDGARFWLQNGSRYEILDAQSQSDAGITESTSSLTRAALSSTSVGSPIVRSDVIIRNRSDNSYVFFSNGAGTKVPASVATTIGAASRSAGNLDSDSIGRIGTWTADFTGLATSTSGSPYVLTPSSRVSVQGGGIIPANGVVVSDPILNQWSDGGSVVAGDFIKAANAPTIYLVTSDAIRPFDSWSALLATATDGDTTWTEVTPALLSRLNVGPAVLPAGTLVRSYNRPDVYLIDGVTSKVRISSFAIAAEAGYRGFTYVSQSALDGYVTNASDMTYGYQCGAQKYIAAGGSLHAIPAGQEALYPIRFTSIDQYTCARTPKGDDATSFIRTPDGVVFLLEGGKKRPISSWARWLEISNGSQWINVQPGLAALIPTGAPA